MINHSRTTTVTQSKIRLYMCENMYCVDCVTMSTFVTNYVNNLSIILANPKVRPIPG